MNIRISWNISGHTGNGLWFPEKELGILLSHVLHLNAKYGEGTHWIEKDLQDEPKG